MIKNALKVLFVFSVFSALTSCATLVNGSHQSVSIVSNPSNAYIWIDRQYVGNTPAIFGLTRSDNHLVTIQIDGYYPAEVIFFKSFSGWVLGNIVFGGVIGVAVDAVSGGDVQVNSTTNSGTPVCTSNHLL